MDYDFKLIFNRMNCEINRKKGDDLLWNNITILVIETRNNMNTLV